VNTHPASTELAKSRRQTRYGPRCQPPAALSIPCPLLRSSPDRGRCFLGSIGGLAARRQNPTARRRIVAPDSPRRGGLGGMIRGAEFGRIPRRYQYFPPDTYPCQQVEPGEGEPRRLRSNKGVDIRRIPCHSSATGRGWGTPSPLTAVCLRSLFRGRCRRRRCPDSQGSRRHRRHRCPPRRCRHRRHSRPRLRWRRRHRRHK
jgi:hypothetical protein